jgi:CO/xanthine dehydrogenase Mo-binding subunit
VTAEGGGPSRRELLRGALAGGALCIGASLLGPGCGGARAQRIRRADRTGELRANAFITILPSGVVSLACNKTEMGQGVTTAYATLVAEELEVDPGEIELHFADSLPEYRTTTAEGMPLFAIHATGGSTSVKEAYVPLRRAAAAAREMLVGAAAAELRVPARECAVRDGRVHHEASGRSLGYGELTRAAARLPVPSSPAIKEPARFRWIGKRNARVDALGKVTGKTIYGIDVTVPGMVCAHAIHGPRYGARPRQVRADAARRSPGVIDVLALPWGVAVVAAKYWQALRAARLVEVDWGEGRTAGLDTAALARDARAHRGGGAPVRDDGDARGALRRANGAVLDAVYEVPYLAHAPLEPQNCTVSVKGSSAEVWVPCQVPTVIQETVADAIGISADDVVVHTTFAGGGFGRRLMGDYAAQAASIAKAIGRPVKMIWSRESDMIQGFYRPAAITSVRGALDGRGRATALAVHTRSQPIIVGQWEEGFRGGQPTWMPAFMRDLNARSILALTAANTSVDMFAAEGAAETPYRISNLRVEYTPIHAGIPVASWRSVGHSFTAFVIEGMLDELAHAAKQDPYAFRAAHLPEGSRERRVLDAAARLAGWGGPVPAGHARGIARHTAFGTEVAEVAEVTLDRGRIRVTRVWAVVDCGIAINPDLVKAQIEGAIIFGLSAALDQEITMIDGVVQQTNFDTFPPLRMFECPAIEVAIQDSAAEPSGAGEPGLPPIGPAVANAVFALTGVRLRRMPLQQAYDAEQKS